MLTHLVNTHNQDIILIMFVVIGLLIACFVWLSFLSYFLIRSHRQLPKPPISSSAGKMHFSLLRFNPFSDTGGEQSFIISLLDGGGNGILLTSLHGRGVTRIYAKRVTAGKTDQELSSEEKKALSQALDS
jgi:Protein of unknown function (DUF4446)